MKCKHGFEVVERKDVPQVGFYKTKGGLLSARYEALKCKKCGRMVTKPIDA